MRCQQLPAVLRLKRCCFCIQTSPQAVQLVACFKDTQKKHFFCFRLISARMSSLVLATRLVCTGQCCLHTMYIIHASTMTQASVACISFSCILSQQGRQQLCSVTIELLLCSPCVCTGISAHTTAAADGSYEVCNDPYFSSNRLSLVDRGFIFAIAHARGGGEMGRQWYEDGKYLHKKNTFVDFVACAKHLVAKKYTSPSKLCIEVSTVALLPKIRLHSFLCCASCLVKHSNRRIVPSICSLHAPSALYRRTQTLCYRFPFSSNSSLLF